MLAWLLLSVKTGRLYSGLQAALGEVGVRGPTPKGGHYETRQTLGVAGVGGPTPPSGDRETGELGILPPVPNYSQISRNRGSSAE